MSDFISVVLASSLPAVSEPNRCDILTFEAREEAESREPLRLLLGLALRLLGLEKKALDLDSILFNYEK